MFEWIDWILNLFKKNTPKESPSLDNLPNVEETTIKKEDRYLRKKNFSNNKNLSNSNSNPEDSSLPIVEQIIVGQIIADAITPDLSSSLPSPDFCSSFSDSSSSTNCDCGRNDDNF